MRVDVSVHISAPPATVWSIVSDLENATDHVAAIERIEVLERPAQGLVGFKWRETRVMFGKQASEVMWITDVVEGACYTTEARSHGSVYRTEVRVEPALEGCRLSMHFEAQPTTRVARFVSVLLRPLMRRSVREALRKDLEDLKARAESRGPGGEA